MGALSQSQFLQALGWATLNSFWQMAILWCVFLGTGHLFKFNANKRYLAAVGGLFLGFAWFVVSAVSYYQNNSSAYAFFQNSIPHSNRLLTTCLLSASVTYLLLLLFPAVRLFKNWRFVQTIRMHGLVKADLNYRLFVRNVAERLNIGRNVKLVASHLVSSPLTVGYLKPVILLPVAALNNLTTAQVEAILLHELSHIRRCDYLVNLIASVIHTLLYFNPFVKLFMNTLAAERETCCDELVLQFGYDKVGYASALLHLEKSSAKTRPLALAAADGQNLLTRIEKIVGMEKKKPFRLVQIIPLLAALLCVLLFNSVLIIRDAKTGSAMAYANDAVFMPWQLQQGGSRPGLPAVEKPARAERGSWASTGSKIRIEIFDGQNAVPAAEEPLAPIPTLEAMMPVTFDDVNGRLTAGEKEDVAKTVEASKKAVSQLHWKEIDASMADVLTEGEKAQVKQEYHKEVEKLNWSYMAQNLAANYDNLNWQVIRENVNNVEMRVQADSLQTVMNEALEQIEGLEKEMSLKAKVKSNPVPDCSLREIQLAKETLRKNLEQLNKVLKPRKVVDL